ncbi:endonuclease 8-like 1 [Macrobrachium nipponense]|uniref:endonuclease 8-like 1 n=1 Tax=Macrobrachium nipponense TaxID=159736 RepID=UPI0030C86558
MPEGPEIFLASLFINTVSKGRSYGGRVVKSEVSTKNPDVEWDFEKYHISAVARGKELKVTLTEGEEDKKNAKWIDILFRFGMSGSFKFTSVADLPKHAHLRFFTNSGDKPMVLSFVDYRRFGRWEVGADWSPERGPDPMWEYESFREHIMSNLSSAAFNKPICEAMLNQKFFNGIGNYLRAEILYRCGVRPFDRARDVLEELKPFSQWYTNKLQQSKEWKVKVEDNQVTNNQNDKDILPDILDLCHIVPKEVINLEGGGKGYNVDHDADEEEYAAFREWLQCYNQDGMKNLVDSNKRTIWFSGEPGKLVPKGSSSRRGGDKKRKNDADDEAKGTSKKRNSHIKKEDQLKKKQAKIKDKVAVQKPKISNSKKAQQKAKGKTNNNENGNIKTETKPRKNPKLKVTTQTPLRRSSRRLSSQSNGSV